MMVLSGTFYLILLFVMRTWKISRDLDLGSPRASKGLKCAAAGGQILVLGLLAVPGILLLRMHGPAAAIIGAVVVVAVGLGALLVPHRPLHRRAPQTSGSRSVFLLAAVLFWAYLIQLSAASTTRFFPQAVVRNGRIVCRTAWKGAGFRENMLPLVGLWYLVGPDYYYTERPGDSGKTVSERVVMPTEEIPP